MPIDCDQDSENCEYGKQRFERFLLCFGASYKPLAYYAALPFVLTPELLHYLRNQFLRTIPWEAEVDLLLSDLCRPVGYEQYAMDTAVRAYLLDEMVDVIGQKQMAAAAQLLISYIKQLERTNPSLDRRELEAQQWGAMVYIEDQRQEAVRQISQAYQVCATATSSGGVRSLANRSEMLRLSKITQELAPQISEYAGLLAFAELVRQIWVDPTSIPPEAFRSYAVLDDVELHLPEELIPAELASNKDTFSIPIEVFFAYSHKDEKLRDELAKHLSILERQAVIAGWHDRKIVAGEEWDREISQHLNTAQAILLLVSSDFIASDYCWDVEVERAMQRHEAGDACVIPVILRPVNWRNTPFGKLQALPKDAKPIISWTDQEEAFLDVEQGIETAAEELRKRLPTRPKPNPFPQGSNASGNPAGFGSNIVLEEPEGLVPLDSSFYIERTPIEADCYETVVKPGSMIRIKAPRQMGKSSLMIRILDHAKQQGCETVFLNFQAADTQALNDLDKFLRWFCGSVTEKLDLPDKLADYWKGSRGIVQRCNRYFERYLLTEAATPLVLGLDEVDQVFEHAEIATDFFGLLRAWHEEGKIAPLWRQLRLVIVHSKEVYVPLSINRSPFNVGLPIELRELNPVEVGDLVQRHGLTLSADQTQQLVALVGGHPFLLRAALYKIARGRMALSDLWRMGPTEGGLFSDHLRRHLLNLEADEGLVTAFKQVLSADHPVQIGSTEAFKLNSMGLVKYQGNEVLPLCDLYRQYFRRCLGVSL